MEADISTLRKTGHFYFALTRGNEETEGNGSEETEAEVAYFARNQLLP
jgi:hypothetical protein